MRVVGQRTSKDTARLIEEVARGDRLLEDIKDPQLRETVRLALHLHKDPFSGPDARTRSRIRSRVFQTLRPRGVTLVDRIAVAFEVLGKPAPYAMRALGVGLIVIAVAASTALVSAGTVADDALYSVKVTSEQMRLALATSPEDRAVVELSIAEHRLAEATALAALGNEDDAIVATSEYGEHMATAAAVVARLTEDPNTASAAAALAPFAARGNAAADLSPAAAIAQNAADTADEAAAAAERKLTPAPQSDASPATGGADRGTTSVDATPRDGQTARNDTSNGQGERVSKKERAAGAARKAADEAKAAAKKAKAGAKHTPAPKTRDDSNSRDD